MRGIIKFVAVGAAAYLGAVSLAGAVPAFDAEGNCGDTALGTRTVDVDNADISGLCYAQAGNLQNADFEDVFAGTEFEDDWQLIDKNALNGVITYDGDSYSFSADLWNEFTNIFLGFHFGNGGGDPDSFVVELLSGSSSGDFTFLGGTDGRPNGLSNIYLFGVCTDDDECRPPFDVPEPGTLALLGLGLAGLGFGARRRKA